MKVNSLLRLSHAIFSVGCNAKRGSACALVLPAADTELYRSWDCRDGKEPPKYSWGVGRPAACSLGVVLVFVLGKSVSKDAGGTPARGGNSKRG